MFRSFVAALALLVLAPAAQAFDVEAMSDAERQAFRAEIRAYLLENPEVLMEAIAVLEDRRDKQAAQQEQDMLKNNRTAIFNDGISHVFGNPDGDVTIVEFSDYRCGYCKRAHPLVGELLQADGNVRLILKEFPILGEQSTLAAQYAIAVKMVEGSETYAEIHDLLMEHNGQLNAGYLARLSRDMDLDHDEIVAKMESTEVADVIRANRELGATLQIQGTPTFIMGENFVRGFVELDQMRAIVRAIRQEQG